MGCKCKPQTRKENLQWAGRNTLVHLDVGHIGLRLRRTTIKIAIYAAVVQLARHSRLKICHARYITGSNPVRGTNN